jgi:hypothetical protein
MTSSAADRIPEILRRYLATEVEDYEARVEPVRDLAAVIEEIGWAALLEHDAVDSSTAPDGVAIESVSTADQKLETEGKLWLLDPKSRSIRLTATFWLSPDLRVVTAYEVKIADPSREPRDQRTRSSRAEPWSIVARSTATGSQEGSTGA